MNVEGWKKNIFLLFTSDCSKKMGLISAGLVNEGAFSYLNEKLQNWIRFT